MSTLNSKYLSLVLALLALTPMTARAVWPPPSAAGEELAVWQAMAETVARENTQKPYKLWYSQSDFAASSFIASALSDPDREEFCGLSAQDVKEMVAQLKTINADPIQLESKVAESVGFKIAHKKNPRFRYFALSRVVFDPPKQKAWLSIELNGERGSIVRLDKVGGAWSRASKCGGWYMPEQ
jgi:hypothetical protein